MDPNIQPVAPQPIALPQGHSTEQWLYKASFARRIIAYLLDNLIVALPFSTVFIIMRSLLMRPESTALFNIISNILAIGFIIIYLGYFIGLTFKTGTTPGKQLLSMRVVSTNGVRLTLVQIILRETLGKFLSHMIMNLGFLWMVWDKDRQTWHDKIGSTYVITKVPNNGKASVLDIIIVILFFLIPIISILAVVVLVAINPLNTIKKSRDSRRMFDLRTIETAIVNAKSENPNFRLCAAQGTSPCKYSSYPQSNTPWLPIKLNLSALPIDPSNTATNNYTYCAKGKDYEVETMMEDPNSVKGSGTSNKSLNNKYEIGTNTKICESIR